MERTIGGLVTSAFAWYDTSYVQKTPYLSPAELYAYPTALDFTNLVPGNAEANAAAVREVLGRVSSWIDGYTCGAWGTLVAAQNSENARVWGNRMGQLVIHPKYWPILSVDSFSYGVLGYGFPSASASINPSTSVWIEPQQFVVQPQGVVGFGLNAPSGITTCEYFCEWQYTNGWPNTYLSASVAAGSASIQPQSVTGIYPNTPLRIDDSPYNEAVTVASTYVTGTAIVPLTSNLAFNHSTSAVVSNLPGTVKEAAVLVASAFVKQPGSGGVIVADISGVSGVERSSPQNAGGDLALAMQMLDSVKMRYVGY